MLVTSLNKNLLGNKQWRAVDSIKHCENKVIFQEFDFETSELDFEVPKSSI